MPLDALRSRLTIDGAPHGVAAFRVVEALDAPFRVTAHVQVDDAMTDTSAWVGTDAALVLERLPNLRRFVGLVTAASDPRAHTTGTAGGIVRVEIEPALSWLARRRNTRMFQAKTAPEILEAVLGEALGAYGRSARLELDEAYARREYCMQYQETDLDFVSRLMEEEGITYTFDHDGDVEVLVLRDRNGASEPVENAPTDGEVRFDPRDVPITESEPVQHFSTETRATPTAVTARDFDWTAGRYALESEAPGADARGHVRESYEHGEGRSFTIGDYDEGVRRYQSQDGARRVAVRREELVSGADVGAGLGRVIGFTPGRRFRLVGHPGLGDAEWLLRRVVHSSEPAPGFGGAAGAADYHNRFEVIPLETPHRPRRVTPKPRIMGVQTAVVTGPAGEEIHTDEWGRVKVLFHWDRESPADETSSVWLRCRQEWTGNGFGWLWTPRIGHEVVVTFVDGDPDRPIAFGGVYDANLLPPYDLPAEKTKSTIKSNSSLGGGGFNEIRFEDAAGSEEYFFHSQKDTNEIILNCETITVGANQTIDIGNDHVQTIGVNQTEAIGANQTLDVGANRGVDVGATFTEDITGTSTIQVDGHATETLEAGETQTVHAGRTETVNGGETRTVTGGQTETISGGLTQTVSGGLTQTVNGAVTESFDGSHACTVTGTFTHSVAAAVTVTTPSTYRLLSPAGYTNIALAGQNILAPGGYRVIAASNQTWIAPLFIKLTGINVEVEGFKMEWDSSLKASVTGLSLGLTGVKAEFATGLELKNDPIEIKQTGAEAKLAGCVVEIAGVHVSVSAVKLQV